MKLPKELECKLDQLILLLMTTGVQPSELADNIFLLDYHSLSFYKETEFIIGEVCFKEGDGSNNIVTLKYYYDACKNLLKILESSPIGVTILWDRSLEESTLVNDIVNILKLYYNPKRIDKFVGTLPLHLQKMIIPALQITA